MKLNELQDRPGARRSRLRRGRGLGSGRGKNGGTGHKGQKSRSGVAINGFEGGQMPIYRRLPKRGFKNPNRKTWDEVNLGRVQAAIDAGRLDASQPITQEALTAAGVIGGRGAGVRLLATGDLSAKATFHVAHASEKARAAVEAAGGAVEQAEPVRRAPKAKTATEVDSGAQEG